MGRSSVDLELSPGRVTLRTGGAPAVSIEFDEALWESAWDQDLRPLDAPLREALARSGVSSGDACILHRGPTAVAEVFSYPAPPRRALEAARLALADALGSSLDAAVWSLRVLDASRSEPPQTVVLAVGDSIQNAERLAAWAARAGLNPVEMTPSDAPSLARVAAELANAKAPDCRALLRIDEGSGVFGAREHGRLAFVRRLGIGLEHFVAALTRPIHPKDGAPIQLTRDEARALLLRCGVPTPDEILDDTRSLRGADILPLLQPVLQRLLIETKQSLRFGLDDAARQTIDIVIEGPAAKIPRFAATVADAVERPVRADPDPGGKPLSIAALSTLAPSASSRIVAGRAAWAMRFGAAAAALAMAGQFYLVERDLVESRVRIALLEPAAAAAEAALAAEQNGRALAAAVAVAEARLAQSFGRRADWLAILRELAATTPDTVRFSGFSSMYESGAPVAAIEGVAFVDEAAPDAAPANLMNYVESLRRSALIERVELGEIQRAELDGRGARRFSLRLALVGGAEWPGAEAAP